MRVAAGTVLVGAIHKYPCLNFIMSGIVEVRSEQGAMRIEAPAIYSSPAGTKRAMVVIEDLIWVTVHPTTETDPEKMWDLLIAEDFDHVPSNREMLETDL